MVSYRGLGLSSMQPLRSRDISAGLLLLTSARVDVGSIFWHCSSY
jgi:hypothetical protein